MTNPFLDRAAKKATQSRAYWQAPKQEKALAKRLGGLQVPASGSKRKKGDIQITGIVRIETKCTENRSFSVTREMVDKISEAAVASNELPVIVVEFLAIARSLYPKQELAVIPMYALEYLIDIARRHKNDDTTS